MRCDTENEGVNNIKLNLLSLDFLSRRFHINRLLELIIVNNLEKYCFQENLSIFIYNKFLIAFQARAEGYKTAEAEFIVTSQEVTIQNITMYPTRVVSDQSKASSEGPWEKLSDNGQDLTATAGPVVNGESSTFLTQLSTNDKFGETFEQTPEESEEMENEYSGLGISKEEDSNSTDIIPPTADAVSDDAKLGCQISILGYISSFAVGAAIIWFPYYL